MANTDDPEHWRQRAEEARRIAQTLSNRTAQQLMLECAKAYDRMTLLAAKSPITRTVS